ncbi:jg9994 [Pararge aegeria aegeria]|uniref:Jg9994 protein n=1 Tax=Pararge aegeria aegeria TaxID=348720 RepID=A0A8S4SEB8_9NEOP|nr:jg9994 [Pararge aegeria aegeria]
MSSEMSLEEGPSALLSEVGCNKQQNEATQPNTINAVLFCNMEALLTRVLEVQQVPTAHTNQTLLLKFDPDESDSNIEIGVKFWK